MIINKIGKKNALLLGVVLVLALLPLALQGNARILNILILSLMWGVVASSWNLSIGYANIWSFGHIAFFAIGGYTLAMTTLYLGMPPVAAILLGGLLAAGFGIIIGLFSLRLSGVYVAMVTFGLHLVLPTFILWQRAYTKGSLGLFGLPALELGQYVFSRNTPVFSYYVILGISFLLFFLIYKIIHSPMGLAFVALRDSNPFAKSLGINEYKYKLIVFGISAFIAGLMGAIFTIFYSAVSPVILGLDIFLMVLIMLMLGGVGRFPGAIIGAFVITFTSESMRGLGLMRYVILGAIVVAVMIALPQGLMGIPDVVRPLIKRAFGRRHAEKEAPESEE